MNHCKYCQNYGKPSPCACVLGGERATSIWGQIYAGIRLNENADSFSEDENKEQMVVTTTATHIMPITAERIYKCFMF